jgi:short-chain fatty acids transporter
MPDPFVLAVLLTGIVFVAAVLFGDAYPADSSLLERFETTLLHWKDHLFDGKRGGVNKGYLYFAFQMCVMLVTGHALATSRPVGRVVGALARAPRTPAAAVAMVAFVACSAALVHWALGLIVGALIARETGRQCARRGLAVEYPLLGAAGYTGLMVWGGGLSGSIPLKAMDYVPPVHLAQGFPFPNGIPQEETLFSTLNFAVCGALVLFVPLVAALLHPRSGQAVVEYREGAGEDVTASDGDREGAETGVEKLESSPMLAMVLGALGLLAMGLDEWGQDFKLTFNKLNLLFLFLGILFQGSLIAYVRAVGDGVRGCAGILLQFPFYFGILGILFVSGLASQISAWIASISTEATYPVATYLSAGIVNFFVPSGGGQWIVQKDIVIEGALQHGDSIGRSILAMAYGDGWTNMLQPFWAVPLLAITGLKAREIIGYTATIMILAGALTMALLLFI